MAGATVRVADVIDDSYDTIKIIKATEFADDALDTIRTLDRKAQETVLRVDGK